MRSSIRCRTELWITLGIAALLLGTEAAADPPLDATSRHLTELGQRAYETARFDEAISAYQEAYQQSALPGLLFNLAQCHRQKGEHQRALFLYQRYLDLAPKARSAPIASEWVRRLSEPLRPGTPAPLDQIKPRGNAAVVQVWGPYAPSAQHASTSAQVPSWGPIHRRWWFWAGLGTALAAGSAAAVIASQPGLPRASLGTGDLR